MGGVWGWGLGVSADGILLAITGLFRGEQVGAWARVELEKEKE